MSRTPVSGTSHLLCSGDYTAVVASVGASLRSLTHQGRDLVLGFGADTLRPAYRGATLAPWPNRVVDGRYRVAGAEHQLPLTEPERSHALHGLLAWVGFVPFEVGDDRATLCATIEPQAGYPWRVEVETTYALDDDGLTQTVRATNRSDQDAPWGTGPHPYLVAGAGTVDDWVLHLPADEVLDVTPDRLVPTVLRRIGEGEPGFDFRTPRRIGDVRLDHAFSALARGDDGRATVRVMHPAGTGVAISWDAACPWVQVHTADLPGGVRQEGHRAGLAVEPMTCAPDAFNAGSYEHDTGLLMLAPGGSTAASWRISAVSRSERRLRAPSS